MLGLLITQQFTYSLAQQSTGMPGWLSTILVIGSIAAFYGVIYGLVKIGDIIGRKFAEIDKKLLSIFTSEFPNYDYPALKSEILYSYSKLYKCPRCGGLLERRQDSIKPMKCRREGCKYPERKY